MHLVPGLLRLIGLVFLLCFSILLPTAARPLAAAPNNVRTPHSLDLGGGWTFSFTNEPSVFYPIELAAGGMNYLYEAAKTVAIFTARNPAAEPRKSPATAFRVGHFALVFVENFDASYGDTFRALVFWPAVATFCEKMQHFVNNGEVLYYEGIIQGTGGTIMVQLRVLPDAGRH